MHIYIYTYIYVTIHVVGYHSKSFVATHALGHMILPKNQRMLNKLVKERNKISDYK